MDEGQKEQIKAMETAMQKQLDAFKENSNLATVEQVEKMFEKAATDETLAPKFKELMDAAKAQGEAIALMTENAKKVDTKETIESALKANKEVLDGIVKDGAIKNKTGFQIKTINASSFSNITAGYNDMDMGEVAQGKPFALEMLKNSITVPKGNLGSIDYWYQDSPTNNAGDIAENSAATASAFTWTRDTLAWKRINANTKVSIYQLNDINWLNGEVRKLLMTDFMLELQSQLISGTGLTTNMNGLLSYATEFAYATYADSVPRADLIDMINTIQRQITELGKDKYSANRGVCVRKLLWDLQIAKDDFGRRLYPEVAISGNAPVVNGVSLTTNELKGSNSLLVGDMNYATLYNWDGIQLDFMQIDDDELNKLVTVSVNARMNLLVKPTDVNAIVKVTDYATALAAITEPTDA